MAYLSQGWGKQAAGATWGALGGRGGGARGGGWGGWGSRPWWAGAAWGPRATQNAKWGAAGVGECLVRLPGTARQFVPPGTRNVVV